MGSIGDVLINGDFEYSRPVIFVTSPKAQNKRQANKTGFTVFTNVTALLLLLINVE